MKLISVSFLVAVLSTTNVVWASPAPVNELRSTNDIQKCSPTATCIPSGKSCTPCYIGNNVAPCCGGRTCIAAIVGVGGWCS